MVKQNLIIYSEQLGNASGWTTNFSSVSANQIASPVVLGSTVTASKITDNNVNNKHGLYNAITYSLAKGQTYTFSAYIKNGDIGFGGLHLDLGNGSIVALINLTTGVITSVTYSGISSLATATSTNAGNGWWKVSVTFTLTTNVDAFPQLVLASNSFSFSYAGTGKYLYATGVQLVQANWSGEYILTTNLRINDGNPPRNKIINRAAKANKAIKSNRAVTSNRKSV